jgi:hypothetical protein
VTNTGPAGSAEPPEIDISVPHVARVYDYLLGGKANFKVDRDAADRAYASFPGGIDGVRADVRAQRAVLGRMVRYLVRDAGIRQFLDIGTGIPAQDNVHQVAQAEAPEARVVYVDKDPIVLAHAHRLLRSAPQGVTSYIYGNLAEPGPILDAARQTLDFDQPVAVMLFGILHFFSDADEPGGLLDQFMTPLAPGSYLAISHLASDVHSEELDETFRRLTESMRESVILRSHDEVLSLFSGLELVEPGVVQITRWRPDPGSSPPPESMAWSGLARKAS